LHYAGSTWAHESNLNGGPSHLSVVIAHDKTGGLFPGGAAQKSSQN